MKGNPWYWKSYSFFLAKSFDMLNDQVKGLDFSIWDFNCKENSCWGEASERERGREREREREEKKHAGVKLCQAQVQLS